MKQKIRLWDCYALSATNHIRNNYKGKPEDSPIRCEGYQVTIQLISSIYTVYKSWISTGDILNVYWVGTGKWILKAYRNITERACVCTHAKAPARSGLGLALGLALLLMQTAWFLEALGQVQDDTGKAVIEHKHYRLPTVTAVKLNDSVETARIPKLVPDADLNRFPLIKYRVEVDGAFQGIRIGDTIPEYLWNLPLWVVNHPEGKDTVTLGEYRDRKLLVLDFWASWCSPCVESMDKWERFAGELDEIALIGVHMGFDYNALPFAHKRGWQSVSVIGGNAYMLNRHFFNRTVVSRLVWIKDGRLATITSGRGYDLETVKKFANGAAVDIPMDANWIYLSANESKANLN